MFILNYRVNYKVYKLVLVWKLNKDLILFLGLKMNIFMFIVFILSIGSIFDFNCLRKG